MAIEFFEKIKKWQQDIDMIETKKKEAFVEGSNAAAEGYVKVQKEMSKKIEELTRKNIELREQLSQEYADKEKANREQANRTIKELENAHDTQCKYCRQTMDNEKTRFKTRQMYLAKIINDIELLWQKMYQYSGAIIDDFDIVLNASARVSASKTQFVNFRNELDKLIKDAQPYLNLGLQDGATDMLIEFDKNLGVDKMVPDAKQIEKKKDGGLV